MSFVISLWYSIFQSCTIFYIYIYFIYVLQWLSLLLLLKVILDLVGAIVISSESLFHTLKGQDYLKLNFIYSSFILNTFLSYLGKKQSNIYFWYVIVLFTFYHQFCSYTKYLTFGIIFLLRNNMFPVKKRDTILRCSRLSSDVPRAHAIHIKCTASIWTIIILITLQKGDTTILHENTRKTMVTLGKCFSLCIFLRVHEQFLFLRSNNHRSTLSQLTGDNSNLNISRGNVRGDSYSNDSL